MLWDCDFTLFDGVLVLIMRAVTADIIPAVVKNYTFDFSKSQIISPLDNIIARIMRIVKRLSQ